MKIPNIKELIERPIIRNDQALEVYNKMTDEELVLIDEFNRESLLEKGVPQTFPEWQSAKLAKEIDFEVLYQVFKENINE
jgi:hypothetical protein